MTNHFCENEPKADSLTKTHPWCSLSLSTLQASLRNPQQRPFCIVDHRSKETRKIKNPWCHLLFTLENAGNQGNSWFKMCLWTPSQMIFNYRIYRPLKYEKISSIYKKTTSSRFNRPTLCGNLSPRDQEFHPAVFRVQEPPDGQQGVLHRRQQIRGLGIAELWTEKPKDTWNMDEIWMKQINFCLNKNSEKIERFFVINLHLLFSWRILFLR